MKIKANGISFNYEINGADNAPWLIFSNSLATNLHMWDQQVSDLKHSFRMLAYDQRGHGLTEAPVVSRAAPANAIGTLSLQDISRSLSKSA